MSISVPEADPWKEGREIQEKALERREAYMSELDGATSTGEIITAMRKFAYINADGQEVVPCFIPDGKKGWDLDVEEPLDESIKLIEKYNRGECDEQQLYAKLGLNYTLVNALQKVTKVPYDSDVVHKMTSAMHDEYDPTLLDKKPGGITIDHEAPPKRLS